VPWELHGTVDKEGEKSVWQATTRPMKPTVAQCVLEKATTRAERLAKFHSDLEAYITRESLDVCPG
jgi:hypothetical protein